MELAGLLAPPGYKKSIPLRALVSSQMLSELKKPGF